MSGTVEEVVEPQTRQELEMSDTCGREQCHRDVFRGALVPVWVGNVEQQWCPGCVKEEFGLDYAEYRNRGFRETWLTDTFIVGFVTGLLIMLLLASIFVV